MKSKRGWLERTTDSDGDFLSGSSYTIQVGKDRHNKGAVQLTLTDCNRTIRWYLGKPGDKHGVAKITVVKNIIDEIYNHLTSVPLDESKR